MGQSVDDYMESLLKQALGEDTDSDDEIIDDFYQNEINRAKGEQAENIVNVEEPFDNQTADFGVSQSHTNISEDIPMEMPIDTVTDIPVDIPMEMPIDTVTDIPVDVPMEMPTATVIDTPVDVPIEMPVDMTTENTVDTSVEMPVDIAMDNSMDTTVEMPVDAMADVPVDGQGDVSDELNSDELNSDIEISDDALSELTDVIPESEEVTAETEAESDISIPDMDSISENVEMPEPEPLDLDKLFEGDLDDEDNGESEETAKNEDSLLNDMLGDLDKLTESSDSNTEDDSEEGNNNLEIGGYDLANQDLSALLDDIENMSDSSEESSDNANDESDLDALLSGAEAGDDLSDIGSILEMDANQEVVDPTTATAQAMFNIDSEDDMFDIENVLEENLSPKEKKRLKKEKKKQKKDSFFAKIFAKLFDSIDEEEEGEGEGDALSLEQSAIDLAQEGAAENEQILAELENAEPKEDEGKGKGKKKKDKKKKKGEASGDEDGEDGDSPKDDKKAKKKQEKLEKKEKKAKEKEKEKAEPKKKFSRKKIIVVALLNLSLVLIILAFAILYPYARDISNAKKQFETGNYEATYQCLLGHKLNDKQKEMFEKSKVILKMRHHYDAYVVFMKMDKKEEALSSLIQSVKVYDKEIERAETLGITAIFENDYRKNLDTMESAFGVTEDKAREWTLLSGSPEYNVVIRDYLAAGYLNGEDTVVQNAIDSMENLIIDTEETMQ